jgi:hypothetical protein
MRFTVKFNQRREKMKYVVRNHNGTLLGEFDTKHEAELDAQEYMYQTGNAAYIEEVTK